MEGKKKKNKKKKGNSAKQSDSISTEGDTNQTKPDDSVSNAAAVPDYNHGSSPEMNHHIEAPSSAVCQSFRVPDSDFEQERRRLEENCELQEDIDKIEVEKNLRSHKEGVLEERIKHLRDEVDSCVQREASLANKIDDLQSKNVSLTMKEDGLEERIKRVEMLNQSFALEKDGLEERVQRVKEMNQSFALEKDGLEERIRRVEMNQTFALEKVMELKESRDGFAEENIHLTERISTLESRIQYLETVVSFYDSSKMLGEKNLQQEAAEVIEKPDILNEGFTEKESEIHVEPVQHFESSEIKSVTSTDYASESQEKIPEPNENIETTAMTLSSFSANGCEDYISRDRSQQMQLLGLDDSRISEDVVSVPLDDIIQEKQQPTAEKTVPISDAPLIGAPFRLISFVTKYVSGADLIDRSKSVR